MWTARRAALSATLGRFNVSDSGMKAGRASSKPLEPENVVQIGCSPRPCSLEVRSRHANSHLGQPAMDRSRQGPLLHRSSSRPELESRLGQYRKLFPESSRGDLAPAACRTICFLDRPSIDNHRDGRLSVSKAVAAISHTLVLN